MPAVTQATPTRRIPSLSKHIIDRHTEAPVGPETANPGPDGAQSAYLSVCSGVGFSVVNRPKAWQSPEEFV